MGTHNGASNRLTLFAIAFRIPKSAMKSSGKGLPSMSSSMDTRSLATGDARVRVEAAADTDPSPPPCTLPTTLAPPPAAPTPAAVLAVVVVVAVATEVAGVGVVAVTVTAAPTATATGTALPTALPSLRKRCAVANSVDSRVSAPTGSGVGGLGSFSVPVAVLSPSPSLSVRMPSEPSPTTSYPLYWA